MAVLPESMNQIDPGAPSEALRVVDQYIRYMGERIEFSFSQMGKNVSAAGVSSVQMYILLSSLQTEVATMKSSLNLLTGELGSLGGTVAGLRTDVAALQTAATEQTAAITELRANISDLQSAVSAIETAAGELDSDLTELAARVKALEDAQSAE